MRYLTDIGYPQVFVDGFDRQITINRFGVWEEVGGKPQVIATCATEEEAQAKYGPGLLVFDLTAKTN